MVMWAQGKRRRTVAKHIMPPDMGARATLERARTVGLQSTLLLMTCRANCVDVLIGAATRGVYRDYVIKLQVTMEDAATEIARVMLRL